MKMSKEPDPDTYFDDDLFPFLIEAARIEGLPDYDLSAYLTGNESNETNADTQQTSDDDDLDADFTLNQ